MRIMNALEPEATPGRRNLYVSAQDREIWERAEKLAPESLSALVSELLRRYVAQREASRDRIVVDFEDQAGNRQRKAFKGRMLVSEFESAEPGVMAGTKYSAAQGANGGLAIWYESGGAGGRGDFSTYVSIEEARAGSWPEDFIAAAAIALGEDYAEEIEL